MSEKKMLKQILEKIEGIMRENPNRFNVLVVDLGRMIRLGWDIVRGRFKAKPFEIAIIVGALGYVFFPFDAIPDFVPFTGLVDDAAVLAAAMVKLAGLISRWESEEADV